VTTDKLLKKFYRDGAPINGRVTITGLLRSLVVKTELMKHEYRVKRSERAGPNPIAVWVERSK
jgi:hypothetical protein